MEEKKWLNISIIQFLKHHSSMFVTERDSSNPEQNYSTTCPWQILLYQNIAESRVSKGDMWSPLKNLQIFTI